MSTAAPWPAGAHGAAMLSFNLLPSRWLHASRWAALLPAGWEPPADGDGARHRHCSALILRHLGPASEAVTDWQRREWPLAVLPAARWTQLLRRLGLLLMQRRLRHTIRGDEARALAAAVPPADLAWVRGPVPRVAAAATLQRWLAAQDEALARLPLADHGAALPRLGAALLAQATAPVPAPMRARLTLRAPDAAEAIDAGAAAGPEAAFALVLSVLEELDPPWLSSFPGSR